MQNINENTIRKSIVMDFQAFAKLVDRLAGIDVDYNLCGLSFNGNMTQAYEALSQYFGVRVTSVHADDSTPIGIWITYEERMVKKDIVRAFREKITEEAVVCFAAADYITEHMSDGSIPYYNNDLSIAELPEPLNRLHELYYTYRCPDNQIKDTGKFLYLNYGYVSAFMGIDTNAVGTRLLNGENRFVLSATDEFPLLENIVIMAADTDKFAEQLLAQSNLICLW